MAFRCGMISVSLVFSCGGILSRPSVRCSDPNLLKINVGTPSSGKHPWEGSCRPSLRGKTIPLSLVKGRAAESTNGKRKNDIYFKF